MEIKKINDIQISNAIKLIWETFLQFEAPEYSVEGVQSFRDFIEHYVSVCGYECAAGHAWARAD